MVTYKGICIGGVADGKVYQHEKPEFHVEARRKLPDGTFQKTGAETTYAFLLLLGNLRGDIGCWVPQGASVEWTIEQLLKSYHCGANPPIIMPAASLSHDLG